MSKTLSAKETQKVLDEHYEECLKFWKREKENGQDVEPEKMAYVDVKTLNNDPREPKGALLDEDTVKKYKK